MKIKKTRLRFPFLQKIGLTKQRFSREKQRFFDLFLGQKRVFLKKTFSEKNGISLKLPQNHYKNLVIQRDDIIRKFVKNKRIYGIFFPNDDNNHYSFVLNKSDIPTINGTFLQFYGYRNGINRCLKEREKNREELYKNQILEVSE